MQCRANSKRSGKRCEKDAMKGGFVCSIHGGKTPVVARKAAMRQAIASGIGELMQINPADALLWSVWEAAGNVSYWRDKAKEEETAENLARYDLERDRLVKNAATCIHAGIAERQVRLAEQQGEMVAQLVLRVLVNPVLELTPGQIDAGRRVASDELRRLGEELEKG